MRKALQNEHRAQFHSQPSETEPQSSVSLPEHASRKRKTSDGPGSIDTRGLLPPHNHGHVTYGKRSKSIISSPLPGESGYATREMDKKCWDLNGTMREDYAHHDPMTLFPEPSSTIANATQTQIRVMEAVRDPMPLDSCSEVDPPRNLLPPEPSVPWSDIMKFTQGDPNGSGESSNRSGHISEWASATPVPTMAEIEALVSQNSRLATTTLLKSSPLRHEVAQEDSRLLTSTDKPTEGAPSTPSLKTISRALKSSQTGPKQSSQPTHPPRSRLNLATDSSDDLAFGLPQEQYKPRPSRSRSLKTGTQDAIDYSVIPERARKVSKRRKTAEVPSSVKIPTTPQKIEQICDMGFTPTTTKNALHKNNGDVTLTVEWLVTNRIGEDELFPHDTPKRPQPELNPRNPAMDPEGLQDIMRSLNEYRKDEPITPQSCVSAPVTAGSVEQDELYDGEATHEQIEHIYIKSPKVQVVIQKKSPGRAHKSLGPSQKRAKRRKTTLDQPEPESSAVVLVLPEAAVEKKKSRGRPKKLTEDGASIDPAQDLSNQGQSGTPQLEALQLDEIDLDLKSEHNTKTLSVKAALERPAEVTDAPCELTSPVNVDKISTTVQPANRSSNNTTLDVKGKVPYRVGLSRRARIAPLLRVMKK